MRCDNCNTKIGKPLVGKENKLLSKENTKSLNDFLPETLRKSSFCDSCINQYTSENAVMRKYHYDYINKLKNEIVKLEYELTKLDKEKQNLILEYFNKIQKEIKIYSNVPSEINTIEFVESFIIVDSGMWSTSSDNLDAFWSAVHDNAARSGSNTSSLIKKGLDEAKELIKREAFINKGNCVVDFKYKFSELAGNGKILILAQGMAGKNPNQKEFELSDIDKIIEKDRKDILNCIEENSLILKNKSVEKLTELITSF